VSRRVRPASPGTDGDSICSVLEPILRAGDTYALPRDWSRDEMVAFWFAADHEVFVAEAEDGAIVGTYFLCPNRLGGGAHVANAGYATSQAAQGKGVARAVCAHSIEHARARGFRAMQFNFVIATNVRAVEVMGSRSSGRCPARSRIRRAGTSTRT
jgi:GNAT superfamily N-acetyltransferase